MLGLRRGIVKISPHQKSWRRVFEREKNLLTKTLDDLFVAIEHIGSTSVVGLPAKPIIDLDVGVRSTGDFKKMLKPLADLGYSEVKNKSSPSVHKVFAKGSKTKGTYFYLHLVKFGEAI